METLGSLCDKLVVVNLKLYHTESIQSIPILKNQKQNLCDEIDRYIISVKNGYIKIEDLAVPSEKVYTANITLPDYRGDVGELMFKLADINCKLWHEVDKSYNFKDVPASQKDEIVQNLAVLNLQRNKCIESIDKQFKGMMIL